MQVVQAAVSPVYSNNPSYGVLRLDDLSYKIVEYESYFLMLNDGATEWKVYKIMGETGVDLNDAASVRAHDTSLLYNY